MDNNSNYLFVEDARVYKKTVLTLTIICYTVFVVLTALLILNTIINKSLGENFGFGIAVICVSLFFAIYFNWGYCSKYLKYYMYINDKEIKFFANGAEHVFPLEQMHSFEVIKSNNRYTTLKLNFENEDYTITTFKYNDLKNILNYFLDKKQAN